ncbi:helix-turn-helix domain-containing protein [Solibacillus isronensis]|uniref:helix-turn-helix domain-containing protein n=1 Tax=Solibacillus isronensis TaxID=412383 RepID=UPI0009A754DF|nr:helix-turn-helix transcriptional regulator [Solibacillus isronensis]
MKPDRVKVGLRLKVLKDTLGISLAEFAERIESTKGTFNSYLRGVALPPETIVDKIAIVTNATKEWIYFGTAKEYMEGYLENLNTYEEFKIAHPDKLDEIVREFEDSLGTLKITHGINELSNLKELSQFYSEAANEIFISNYNIIFSEYVERLVVEYIKELEKYPIYNKLWTSNGRGYLSVLHERLSRIFPKPRYGEDETILKIAEEQYELLINKILLMYKDDADIERGNLKTKSTLEYLIRKFSTYEGIENLLKDISVRNNLIFNPNAKENEELIEFLMTTLPKLKQIKNNK